MFFNLLNNAIKIDKSSSVFQLISVNLDFLESELVVTKFDSSQCKLITIPLEN